MIEMPNCHSATCARSYITATIVSSQNSGNVGVLGVVTCIPYGLSEVETLKPLTIVDGTIAKEYIIVPIG
jgi:hypothetical protein